MQLCTKSTAYFRAETEKMDDTQYVLAQKPFALCTFTTDNSKDEVLDQNVLRINRFLSMFLLKNVYGIAMNLCSSIARLSAIKPHDS